jgi:hypothetical protein
VLHLYDNPLEFLPEISPCAALLHLTVANMRITSDSGYSQFKVELLPPPPGSSSGGGMVSSISLWDSSKQSSDKLRPIFRLMLRRSGGHHPLLAGALRELTAVGRRCRAAAAAAEPARSPTCLPAWTYLLPACPVPLLLWRACPAVPHCSSTLQARWQRKTQRIESSWRGRRTGCSSW